MLDVGCGTGAITADIAQAVKPEGYVVGVDRDETLLDMARTEHAGIENLQFERRDATALKFLAQFDIVTSARALQWIAEPHLAVENMRQAAKCGGVVVILDYNHTQNKWEPEPPPEFKVCYGAFLAWRQANGWDNEMADHLPELFRLTGLTGVRSSAQDEVVKRGDPEFEKLSFLWSGTLRHLAGQLVAAGFCTVSQLEKACERYETWARTGLVKQTLAMQATVGTAP